MHYTYLHGAGQHAAIWQALQAHLPGHAPDLPGRAQTPGPPLTTIAEMAHYIIAQLHPDTILVGHSMGGAIALEIAAQYPLKALILISTGARLRVHPAILAMAAEAAQTQEPIALGPLACHPNTPDTVRHFIENIENSLPPQSTDADWQATHAFDRLNSLHNIKIPTHIYVGSDDTLTPPKYAQHLHQHLPNATLTQIENAGHHLPIEQTEFLAHSIKKWCDTCI